MSQRSMDGGAADLARIEDALDLEAADRQGLPGLYRLNVYYAPALRLIGFNLVAIAALLHNAFLLRSFSWDAFIPLWFGLNLYCFAVWLVLYLFFTRAAVHLGALFLGVDVLVMLYVVYFTGGEKSWLFFLPLVRVADQLWTGRTRALAYAHVAIVGYVGLLLYLGLIEHRAIVWPQELVKAFFLAATSLYLAAAAGTAWGLRERTLEARQLILRLHEQSARLEEARARAEAANWAKSQFLTSMSHELRTPLGSIIGFANMLRKKRAVREDAQIYLDRVLVNSRHLLGLINDLLDLSKIEAGRMDVHLGPTSVRKLVDETIGQLEGRLVGNNVELYARVPADVATIEADPAKLKQILINLVDNAIKFTEEGSVVVELAVDPATRRPLAITVIDSGMGIEPDRLDAIFEAFEQGGAGVSHRFGGSGLGLAISRSLCEMLGYRLEVTSELGKGSRFTIHLA